MMGRVRYENMRMQEVGENSRTRRTLGNEQATLSYRRIDDLEQDPLFLAYIQHPLFRQITRRYQQIRDSIFNGMIDHRLETLERIHTL